MHIYCWPAWVCTHRLLAKSVRHIQARVGSYLVIQSQNIARFSVWLSLTPVYWTLRSYYRWHGKLCVLCSCRCIWAFIYTDSMQAACSSPTYCSDKCILEPCSAGHPVSQASMSQAGSVCDLHSHMPGGLLIRAAAERQVLCCSGQVTMEQHGDSAAGGDIKYLPRVRSQVTCFFKGRLILAFINSVHLQSSNTCIASKARVWFHFNFHFPSM